MNDLIPVLKPDMDEQTKRDLMSVIDSGWWGQASKTFEFEKKFADKVGAKYAIGVNSGTAALDLCLKVYGIKSGELITTPMTFVADAIVAGWNGMDVTFADIDPDSLCLDPESVHITKDTKAIITVDSHGRLADIDGLRKKFDGLIIEDAAHAMYTPGAGKKGDITIWSFQAVKSLPTGDGGMITTNDEKIYTKLRDLTWLGIRKNTYERAQGKRYTWDYDLPAVEGLKAYMNDLTSVIGLGQLRRIDELCAKRRAVQARYNDAFRGMKQIELPMYSHTVQYYTMKCENRDELSDFLADKGIATSVHFKPLSEMTAYKQFVKRPLPVTNKVWKQLLSLPVFYTITWEQVEHVIDSVKEFYEK